MRPQGFDNIKEWSYDYFKVIKNEEHLLDYFVSINNTYSKMYELNHNIDYVIHYTPYEVLMCIKDITDTQFAYDTYIILDYFNMDYPYNTGTAEGLFQWLRDKKLDNLLD